MAAARWRASWPRLSFTRALHLFAIRVRIVLRFALEVAKWRAFYTDFVSWGVPVRSITRVTYLPRRAFDVHVGFFAEQEVDYRVAFGIS